MLLYVGSQELPFGLDSKLMNSALGKSIFLILCVRLRLHGLFSLFDISSLFSLNVSIRVVETLQV